MTGKHPNGSDMKMRAVDVTVDADHRTWTAYMTGPEGQEFVGMKISYTRRASP
jgi:hypothetical protein